MLSGIKKIIRPIYYGCKNAVLSLIPLKKAFFFESTPDFQDNARFVYEEMLHRGMNKKYRMYWAVNDIERFKDDPANNTYFVRKGSAQWKRLSRRCKVLMSGNQTFHEAAVRKDQMNIYLGHGAPIKDCGSHIYKGKEINYITVISEYLKEAQKKLSGCSDSFFIYTGLPRNDIFYRDKTVDLHTVFPGHSFSKCVLWMPTFRKNLSGTRVYSSIDQPIIHSESDAIAVNTAAENNDVLVVLKPHFNQNMANIQKMNLSNLIILDDNFFIEKNVMTYDILAAADALLTDYSSVYWDFLNADKPIGLCWEDYEEFEKQNGFLIDTDIVRRASDSVCTMEEFETFLSNLSEGTDLKREERQALNKLINPTRGTASKNVVDAVKSFLKED